MVQKVKEKKGFTLAELLVVVAIIGVLVAVSIPIFTAQLEKAKLATNQANARAAKAAVVAEMISSSRNNGKATYTVSTAKIGSITDAGSGNLSIEADPSEWEIDSISNSKLKTDTAKTWTVQIDTNGKVSYEATFYQIK